MQIQHLRGSPLNGSETAGDVQWQWGFESPVLVFTCCATIGESQAHLSPPLEMGFRSMRFGLARCMCGPVPPPCLLRARGRSRGRTGSDDPARTRPLGVGGVRVRADNVPPRGRLLHDMTEALWYRDVVVSLGLGCIQRTPATCFNNIPM